MAINVPGVHTFETSSAIERAHKNMIVTVYGATKTGKTHFALRAPRPLYLVYLDPNANMDAHLLKAEAEGMDGEVNFLAFPPLEYKLLTNEEAHRRIGLIEDFARQARAEQKGGTFVVDGCIMLKGLYEKALVGESPTLGFRAAAGSRAGYSTYDFAKSNGALRDFVQAFVGSDLDVIITWEGRFVWKESTDENNKKKSVKTSEVRTSMPDALPFAINLNMETMMVISKTPDGQGGQRMVVEPVFRLGWNSYDTIKWSGMVIPAVPFELLKAMLLSDLPAPETALPMGAEIVRANTESLDET